MRGLRATPYEVHQRCPHPVSNLRRDERDGRRAADFHPHAARTAGGARRSGGRATGARCLRGARARAAPQAQRRALAAAQRRRSSGAAEAVCWEGAEDLYALCEEEARAAPSPASFEQQRTLGSQDQADRVACGRARLQDFQPVFDSLATQIVENAGAEIVCEWEIPASVDGQTFSTDLVEVARTSGGAVTALQRVANAAACTAGGWYFDDAYSPQSIIACESTCGELQGAEGSINVAFGCEIVEGCAASDSADLSAGAPVPNDTGSSAPATSVAVGSSSTSDATSAAPPVAVACEWALPEAGSSDPTTGPRERQCSLHDWPWFRCVVGNVTNLDACASAELGWYYDDPEDPTKIVACPATCDVLNSRQITKVQALFGCETKPAKPMVAL